MPKLKKFKINYNFRGQGKCIIIAKTAKEAEKKFNNGEFEPDEYDEWGYMYFFESTKIIN